MWKHKIQTIFPFSKTTTNRKKNGRKEKEKPGKLIFFRGERGVEEEQKKGGHEKK